MPATRISSTIHRPLTRNEVLAVVYVASRGAVPVDDLVKFRKACKLADDILRRRDPGDAMSNLAGVHGVLSFVTVAAEGTCPMTLRALLRELAARAVGSDRRGQVIVEGARAYIGADPTLAALDETVELPRFDLALKLGLRRTRRTRQAYEAALRVCIGPRDEARANPRLDVDVDAAVAALRVALLRIQPLRQLEVREEFPLVARALLAHRAEVCLRGDGMHVLWAPLRPGTVHRMFVASRLARDELAAKLGVPSETLAVSGSRIPMGQLTALPAAQGDLALLAGA